MAKDINANARAQKEGKGENFTETHDDPDWEAGLEFDVGDDMHGDGEQVGTDAPDDPDAPPGTSDENLRSEKDIEGDAEEDDAADLDEIDKALLDSDKEDNPFHDVKALDETQQKVFNRQVGKARKDSRAQQQENQRLQQENQQLRQQGTMAQQQPATGQPVTATAEPVIPAAPDPWDPDRLAKQTAREQAIANQAAWDTQQLANSNQQLWQQEQQNNAIAQDQQQALADYRAKATEQNIDPQELVNAEVMVMQSGTPQMTTDNIMRLDQGANVTMFLSKNPTILANLNNKHPGEAMNIITNKIIPHLTGKGKISKQQRQASNDRPKPSEILRGGGRPELRNDDLDGDVAGASYE